MQFSVHRSKSSVKSIAILNLVNCWSFVTQWGIYLQLTFSHRRTSLRIRRSVLFGILEDYEIVKAEIFGKSSRHCCIDLIDSWFIDLPDRGLPSKHIFPLVNILNHFFNVFIRFIKTHRLSSVYSELNKKLPLKEIKNEWKIEFRICPLKNA
jgi:hypothetical protein